MTQYWFRPKRYGYGATPITWEGWIITGAFAAGLVVAMLKLAETIELTRTGALAGWIVVVGFALFAAAFIGFIRFAQSKTSGEWKWRWGNVD